jgi:hypothetical protein
MRSPTLGVSHRLGAAAMSPGFAPGSGSWAQAASSGASWPTDPLHQQQTEALREFPERAWTWCARAGTSHLSIGLDNSAMRLEPAQPLAINTNRTDRLHTKQILWLVRPRGLKMHQWGRMLC